MPLYWENWDAAGGMYSNPGDLARFADALYGGRLVRPELLARLLRPRAGRLWLWPVELQRHAERTCLPRRQAAGQHLGAQAVLYRLLDEGVTVILLANTNRADLDVFAQRIADRLIIPKTITSPGRFVAL